MEKDKNHQIFPTSRKKTKMIKFFQLQEKRQKSSNHQKNQKPKNQKLLKYQKFAPKTDKVKTKNKQNGTKTKINQD